MTDEPSNTWSYHVTGRVFPERAHVSISVSEPIPVRLEPFGWEGHVYISIAVAQVSLIFVGPKTIDDVVTFKNVAADFTQGLVDAFGYTTGRGYGVEITALTTPDGEHYVFGVGVEVLEDAAADRPLAFDQILPLR